MDNQPGDHEPAFPFGKNKAEDAFRVDRFSPQLFVLRDKTFDKDGNARYWHTDFARFFSTQEAGSVGDSGGLLNRYIEQYLQLPSGSVNQSKWDRIRQKRFEPRLPEGIGMAFENMSRHPYFVINPEGTRAVVFFYTQGEGGTGYRVFTVDSSNKPIEDLPLAGPTSI
jgi:hypothetical protein